MSDPGGGSGCGRRSALDRPWGGDEQCEPGATTTSRGWQSNGTLKRLVDQGLAEELAHRPVPDDDQRRRYYRLTGLGQRVCAAEAERLASLVRITRSAVAQRSTLARAIRTPDSNRRRRRLGTAAVLGLVFLASYVSIQGKDHWAGGEQLLIAIGAPAMIGAIALFIVGLLTPRSPDNRPVTPVA